MIKKAKILFVITSDEYIRNYIETGVLKIIESNHDVKFVIDSKISRKKYLNQNQLLSEYKTNPIQDKRLNDIFDIYMYTNMHKSSSFYFRFLRYKLNKKIPFLKKLYYFLINIFKLNLTFFENYYKTDLIKLKSHNFFKNYFIKRTFINYKYSSQLNEVFESFKPDLVIFPSSAYEPVSFDLIELSIKYNSKTFFIIDNWDNLSSKTILFKKPNYLGVWSEQAREHAINIQDFDPNKIKIIGSARFNNYFILKNKTLPSHFDFKYILFIGTTLEFDEFDVLKRVNSLIENNSKYNNLKIVYRPHPWRQSKKNQNLNDLKNVVIDPQVEDVYMNNKNNSLFQPDLNYYPSLISNAEFLIGGLSSMLIESLIFNKKYVALVHDDNKNLTNQKNALKYFTHFRGIEKLEYLYLCDNLDNLSTIFKNFDNEEHINFMDDKISLDYFIHGSETITYSEILSDSVNQILSEI
jgi:hypothetical protein